MYLNKKLGQHFLNDCNVINDIVDALSVNTNDIIIEIGPGDGAISNVINSKNPKKYFMYEIDKYFYNRISKKIPSANVHNIDFLQSELNQYSKYENIKFVGNLPYNISVEILFKILDNSFNLNISKCIFMVQKEVADKISLSNKSRITAPLKYMSDIKMIIPNIPPTAFTPPPKVNSSVFEMKFKKNTSIEILEKIKNINKILFQNKRKKLKKKLESIGLEEHFKDIIDKRIDEISIEKNIEIAKFY